MAEAVTESVRVDLAQNIDHEPEEVQFALAGLAYIAGALISVREVGVVTEENAQTMAGWESFIDRANEVFTDTSRFEKLELLHPTIGKLIDTTESFKDTEYFERFLNKLIDPMYMLVSLPDDPNHYELRFIGW